MGAFGGPKCALIGTAIIGIKNDKDGSKISGFNLFQNYPNPFNPSTVISYQLPENGHIQLKIFNILGQEVRTLVDGYESSGIKRILWDGKDQNGFAAATGAYIYHLQIKTKGRVISKSKKMILVK
jgi:flagellar hook assembly protein FlgD